MTGWVQQLNSYQLSAGNPSIIISHSMPVSSYRKVVAYAGMPIFTSHKFPRMYIFSTLSWGDEPYRDIQPVVQGYYESIYPWNDIPLFYLDLKQVEYLIQLYEDHPELGRILRLELDTRTLIVKSATENLRIQAEMDLFHGDNAAVVWPISFVPPCYDQSANEDDRLFTAQDIQEAVVYGINAGLAAGFAGTKSIEGMPPVDYAIVYTRTLHGS